MTSGYQPGILDEVVAQGQRELCEAIEAECRKFVDQGVDPKDLVIELYPPEIDTGGMPARQWVVRQRFLVREKRAEES